MAIDPNHVRDVFLAAVDLPDADRAAHLAEVCGSDAELHAAVEQLLSAHAEPASVLNPNSDHIRLFADTASLTATESHSPLPDIGTVLAGRYTLLESIGEGGMGTVWMARQNEPVKRMVAVKLIKRGMDSKMVLARFEAERQALALMDHPNIARVLDAGVTADGRPFFVMDLVKGVPITKFCDAHKLTPRERLELFVPVCNAIQHAHQKGIIHRDIKPSNVLVALYDDRPVPKVIDFGVAKATGQPLTEQTINTGFGAVVGTPQYMSPEQATFNNMDVDTRSDLYSLGVLLYELLTGSPPFGKKDLEKAGLLEMLRVVREVEPQRPSTKLSTADALPSLAANRSTEPKKLTGMLRNELDWIVMKAMEKDRARRYATANGFAADVLRYLSGEPVQAVPPSTGYRLRKFVRRYKRGLAAALVLFLALIGTAIGAGYGVKEAKNREQANRLKDEAEQARDEADELRSQAVRDRDKAETARLKEEAAKKDAESAKIQEGQARKAAEDAKDRLKNEKERVEKARDQLADERMKLAAEREKLARFEYGRTAQVFHQEWRQNDVPAAISLLNSTREDLRGWEWNFVHELCNNYLTEITPPGWTRWAVFSPDGKRVLTISQEEPRVRIWDAATGEEIVGFKGHQNLVNMAVFSPDGKWVLTASNDCTARIWNAESGEAIFTLEGHTKGINSATFILDGKRVVTASEDQTAKVWNAETGKLITTLTGHTKGVNTAMLSSDGKRVVTTSNDGTSRNGTVRVWNVEDGTSRILSGHRGAVSSATFSPDNQRILTIDRDWKAHVWETETGKRITVLQHTSQVNSAKFSPDGKHVVTASDDATATVWEAATGTVIAHLKGHTFKVNTVMFNSDGTRVLTASEDCTARIWDTKTGAEIAVLNGHTAPVLSAEFSSNGNRVLTRTTLSARVWGTVNPLETTILKGHTREVNAAIFSPDCQLVLTADIGDTARIWEAPTGKLLATINGSLYDQDCVAFSPDSKRVVTGREGHIWNARTGELITTLRNKGYIRWASFSPNGTKMATVALDNKGRIWDAATGMELFTLEGHKGYVRSVFFSPNGKWVLTASHDSTARIWDVASGLEIQKLDHHENGVTSAAFSPDGKWVVTSGGDGTVRVWDAAKGEEIRKFTALQSPNSAKFSPNGKRVLAHTENTVQVWDIASKAEIFVIKTHMDPGVGDKFRSWLYFIRSASFSPDGKRIVTASNDRTVRLWDAESGAEVATLTGHTDRVIMAKFSADGKRLVSASWDRTARIWDAGQLSGRIASFNAAIKADPNDAHSHTALGSLLARSGDMKQAIASFWEAIRLDPKSNLCHAGLANALVELANQQPSEQKYRQTLAELTEYSKKFPAIAVYRSESASLHNKIGNLYWNLEKQTEALAEYRLGLALLEKLTVDFPGDPLHRAELAWGCRDLGTLFRRLKNPEEALGQYRKSQQILEELIAKYPAQRKYRTELAAIYLLTGVPGGAMKDEVPANGHIYRTSFAPDGSYFLAAGDMGERSAVRIYSTRTGEFIREFLTEDEMGWSSGRFSPDGSRLVTWGSTSPKLYMWEFATGRLLFKLEGHKKEITQASFSSDGKRIVSGSTDRTLRIWDAFSGKELHLLDGNEDSCAGWFSPDDKWIVSYGVDKTVRVWDPVSGNQLWKHPQQSVHSYENLFMVHDRCFSGDGSLVLSVADDESVRVWESATGKTIAQLSSSSEIVGAVFVKGGSQLAAWSKDKKIRVWDIPSGKQARELDLGSDLLDQPDNVAVSPDGRWLLTGHKDLTVKVRELTTGKQIHQYETASNSITRSLTFSADSHLAVAGSYRGWVYLWSLPSYEQKR